MTFYGLCGFIAPLYPAFRKSSVQVCAVGFGGRLGLFLGGEWIALPVGLPPDLSDVWGSDPTDMYAVGPIGTVTHFDGETAELINAPSDARLNGIYGIAHDDIFAVGLNGNILHFDGESWTRMKSSVSSPLRGVWVDESGEAFAVGDFGVILHLRRFF
jgi:hypothetical protein